MVYVIWIGIHEELLALAKKPRTIEDEKKHPNDYFAGPNEYKGHICYEIKELTDDYIDSRRNELRHSNWISLFLWKYNS